MSIGGPSSNSGISQNKAAVKLNYCLAFGMAANICTPDLHITWRTIHSHQKLYQEFQFSPLEHYRSACSNSLLFECKGSLCRSFQNPHTTGQNPEIIKTLLVMCNWLSKRTNSHGCISQYICSWVGWTIFQPSRKWLETDHFCGTSEGP